MLNLIYDPRFKVLAITPPQPDDFLGKEFLNQTLADMGEGKYRKLTMWSMVLYAEGFPHSVPMQARTHRGFSFDVQSSRYTGSRVQQVADGLLKIEEVFYLRPSFRKTTWEELMPTIEEYDCMVNEGVPHEAARDVLPQGLRQNFVFSATLRDFFHFLDLRLKPDAQPEIQTLSVEVLKIVNEYCPKLAEWYVDNRAEKGILAP